MANKAFTYGFGLAMGLASMMSNAKAQVSGIAPDSTKQKVILSDDLKRKLSDVFVHDDSYQAINVEKMVYYPDSTSDEAHQMGNTAIVTLRISDREQVVMTATDNGDRTIEESELDFVADYTATPRAVECLSSLTCKSVPGNACDIVGNKYKTARMFARSLHYQGQGQFNYEYYNNGVTWVPDVKLQPQWTDSVFDIFEVIKEAREPKKPKKQRKLDKKLEKLGY